jgi:hypothetical protein
LFGVFPAATIIQFVANLYKALPDTPDGCIRIGQGRQLYYFIQLAPRDEKQK